MRNLCYTLGATLALGTTAVLVLGDGAVGIIGDGGRRDLAYVAVLAVGAVGVALSGLRAKGLAVALGAMALTQVAVTVVAILGGLADDASVVDLLWLTVLFASGFAGAAASFHRAAGSSP